MLKMIMCVDNNYGFAKNNKLPWNINNEMEHFIKHTKNKTIVMGSKTFFAIGKVLKDRNNIILTHNKKLSIPNAKVIYDYKQIIKLSKSKDVYIIGGKEIFNLFLKYADEIIISKLYQSYDCDQTYIPNLKNYKLVKTINYKEFQVEYYKTFNQKILYGEPIVNKLISKQIKEFKQFILQGITPTIAIIYIGNSLASQKYIDNKLKYAKLLGVNINIYKYDENVEETIIIDSINKLNVDPHIHGIMVQLPISKHLNKQKILNTINPQKDIDCLNEMNYSKILFSQSSQLIPCTPKAILEFFKFYKINLTSKNIVILGRSKIVGMPIGILLINQNATVTFCHSYSKNINKHLKNADIIISTISRPNFIKSRYIKNNAIIIDVSINFLNNKMIGDADFYNVIKRVKYITPVPGGIGPVTVSMLFENLLFLIKNRLFCTK